MWIQMRRKKSSLMILFVDFLFVFFWKTSPFFFHTDNYPEPHNLQRLHGERSSGKLERHQSTSNFVGITFSITKGKRLSSPHRVALIFIILYFFSRLTYIFSIIFLLLRWQRHGVIFINYFSVLSRSLPLFHINRENVLNRSDFHSSLQITMQPNCETIQPLLRQSTSDYDIPILAAIVGSFSFIFIVLLIILWR